MQKVIALYKKNGSVTRKEAEVELGISQATAILLLQEMTKAGILKKQGVAKNLRYVLA